MEDFFKSIREQRLAQKVHIAKQIDFTSEVPEELKKAVENDIQKGKPAVAGEIREWGGRKYKKQPNGKWLEVSEYGMTKKEHQKETNELIDKQLKSDNHDTRVASERSYNKWKDKNLSDKEYDEEELGGGEGIDNKAKPEEKPVEKKDKEEEYKKDVSEAEDSMYYLLKKFYKEKPAMSSDRRHIEVAKILAKKYKIKYQDLLKQYTPSRNINGEKYWDKNGEIVS